MSICHVTNSFKRTYSETNSSKKYSVSDRGSSFSSINACYEKFIRVI